MDSSSSKLYSTNTTTTKPMGEASISSGMMMSGNNNNNVSLELNKCPNPRDLFHRFLPNNNNPLSRLNDIRFGGGGDDEDEDDGGLNLGLGLSLGGKFGVDKSHKGLVRSSSIVGTMPLMRDGETVAPPPPASVHTLMRTSSLPVESEEEYRRRKEMQTLRRLEAKKRRNEKQRMLREGGGGGGVGGAGAVGGSSGVDEKGSEGVNFRGRLEKEQQSLKLSNKNPHGASPEVKRRRTTFGSLQGFLNAQARTQAQQGCSPGSGESQGGSSSGGASELESKTHQGSSSGGEARSPGSSHSLQDRGSQDSVGLSATKGESSQRPEVESSSKKKENADNKRKETGSGGGMEDMPCVFTIGDGPSGRKVEGILYRYGKGEEVRIMCVCHGTFFSPADFVKHAGGRDVEHPLRHIVVSPSAPAFQ